MNSQVDIFFTVEFVNSNKFVMRTEIHRIPPKLLINNNYSFINQTDFKRYLYHEYTHILDYATLLKDKDDDYKSKTLKIYSEFHASYIEAQIINLNQLENEICETILELERRIKRKDSYFDITTYYMYYFGYLYAFNKIAKVEHKPKKFKFSLDDLFHNLYPLLQFADKNERVYEMCYKTFNLISSAQKVTY